MVKAALLVYLTLMTLAELDPTGQGAVPIFTDQHTLETI